MHAVNTLLTPGQALHYVDPGGERAKFDRPYFHFHPYPTPAGRDSVALCKLLPCPSLFLCSEILARPRVISDKSRPSSDPISSFGQSRENAFTVPSRPLDTWTRWLCILCSCCRRMNAFYVCGPSTSLATTTRHPDTQTSRQSKGERPCRLQGP